MRMVLVLVLQMLYIAGVLGLTIYGGNALWLTWKLLRSRPQTLSRRPILPAECPSVTVQLPIFNERHVAERLIDACARFDYPAERLQIQVLDDSSDETRTLVHRRVRYWQRQGIDIQVINRVERSGFKAGALAHAFALAHGEFLAIFDADFAPPRDFLQQVLPHFLQPGHERVGFVQTRWGHLNDAYSPLTRAQALALDGHFVVEQAGRQAAHYPFGFNGSAGVWRRACIADPRVGGWQTDTLCEDLDLSYRAQLAGWQPCYRNEIVAPAEIPPQLIAFRRQQFRWAKGSVQTLRKLGRDVWRSPTSLAARLAGLIHLGGYLIHPCLLLLLLVTLPLMHLGIDPAPHLTVLSLASLGPPLLYAVAQRRLHHAAWWQRWAYLPLLTLLGTGLSLNNTIAVWQGLSGRGGQFLRTPKFRVESTSDTWQRSSYRLPLDVIWLGELLLLCYALLTVQTAFATGKGWSIPFLLIYAGGYGVMVVVGLWQARPVPMRPHTPKPTATSLGSGVDAS
jgi:cellulose synthase/poly-beta-1,6-N-acetylglucosamine synthase-like glycosyltransferase